MKKQKLTMTQKDGVISVFRNEELEYKFDVNIALKNANDGKFDAVSLANHIAEIMHDCINCKSASCKLTDENGTGMYNGTYFEHIDYLTD